MSFRFRHPTAKFRRGPAPWSFWLWSGGAWVVMASAVFRGEAEAPGPGLATWGPGAGVGDALIASGDQPPGSPLVFFQPQIVPGPESATDPAPAAAQARTLAERSSRWHSLRKDLRQSIDGQAANAPGWSRLVIGLSGDPSGRAADLAFRSGHTGSAAPTPQPHFVIGNGSRSADGMIEATDRPLAEDGLCVLLIGDPHTAPPTAAQLHGLTELIDYLRAKTGIIPVQTATESSAKTAVAAGLPQEALDLAFNQTLTARTASPLRPETE